MGKTTECEKTCQDQEQTEGMCEWTSEISETALDETGKADLGQGVWHLKGLLNHVVFQLNATRVR